MYRAVILFFGTVFVFAVIFALSRGCDSSQAPPPIVQPAPDSTSPPDNPPPVLPDSSVWDETPSDSMPPIFETPPDSVPPHDPVRPRRGKKT